jgi:DNA modification methylase
LDLAVSKRRVAHINEIIVGDSLEVLRERIADDSIDLTVTSPPYDNLRTYNGFSFDFEGIAKELYRVTKPGGVVVWVVGDKTEKGSETLTSFKQAIYFKDIGFNVHDTMIYEKSTSPFPQSNRYNAVFEYMFVLSKGKPATFNGLRETATSNLNRLGRRDGKYRQSDGIMLEAKYDSRKQTKLKRNIWRYAVGMNCTTKDKYAFDHPAMFPEQLAQDHILSWSNPGDVVLDIFGGSGTTAKMSKLNGRDYIYVDISEEYAEIARKRLASIS